jgi:hypothetical protein
MIPHMMGLRRNFSGNERETDHPRRRVRNTPLERANAGMIG